MSFSIPFHTIISSYSPTIQTITRWFLPHKKMWKYLNYRHFRIDDQMTDGFFEKSGLIGYYDRLELKRSDHRSDFRSDDGYSGRIVFHIL